MKYKIYKPNFKNRLAYLGSRIFAYLCLINKRSGLYNLSEFWSFYKKNRENPSDFLPKSLLKFIHSYDNKFQINGFKKDDNISGLLIYTIAKMNNLSLRKFFLRGLYGNKTKDDNLRDIIKQRGGFHFKNLKKDNKSVQLAEVHLKNLRDWIVVDDELTIISDPYIVIINNNGDLVSYTDKDICAPHTISTNTLQDTFLVTSTRRDVILWIDRASKRVVRKWYATKNGYNLNIGAKEDYFISERGSEINYSKVPKGFKIYITDAYASSNTYLHTMHINSGIFHPDHNDTVLFTAFASKKLDANGVRINESGSGGKIYALFKNDVTKQIIGGLSNPHNLTYIGKSDLGNLYSVINSTTGKLFVYLEKKYLSFKKILSLTLNLIDNDSKIKEIPWLIGSTFSTNGKDLFLSFFDGNRHIIRILNLSRLTERRVNIPAEWALQRTHFFPNSN